MKRFVYNEKYAKLLVMMDGKKSHVDGLAREIGAHAGHLRIVLDQWAKEGVINKSKPGREYTITLTDKGEQISKKFAEIMDVVANYKEKSKSPKSVDQGISTEPDEQKGDKNNGSK